MRPPSLLKFFSQINNKIEKFENSQKSEKFAPFLLYFIYLFILLLLLSCHVTIIRKRELFKPANGINPPPAIISFGWFGGEEVFTISHWRVGSRFHLSSSSSVVRISLCLYQYHSYVPIQAIYNFLIVSSSSTELVK